MIARLSWRRRFMEKWNRAAMAKTPFRKSLSTIEYNIIVRRAAKVKEQDYGVFLLLRLLEKITRFL